MTSPHLDRFWLLTWTTYGTRLPGDRRGFVSDTRDGAGDFVIHNIPGTPVDADEPELERAARERMRGSPIYLSEDQALATITALRAQAEFRKHRLFAAAVMANHVHLVVGVVGDPEPEWLLGDFKAYASRALNLRWPKPRNGTWWTRSGSKQKLPDEPAVIAAVRYVESQDRPLTLWIDPRFE